MSIRVSGRTLFIGRFYIGYTPIRRFWLDDDWWEIEGPSLYLGAYPK